MQNKEKVIMGTNSEQRRTNAQGQRRRMSAKQKAARKRRKIIIFTVEILVLLIMVGIFYVVYTTGSEGDYQRVEINEESVEIHTEVQENETMKGYWNIALFGIDAESTNKSALAKGYRSDTIMIASINLDTGDIKLVSVYRDTYLNTTTKYFKANSAYAEGGGEQALKMLNSNLDMNITDFVAISYQALKDTVDGLGGVYIDIDDEELLHINNYQYSIAEVLKCDYTELKSTGYQLLDGMQAAAYCRIRYKAGNDFARAAAQREVLQAIEDQAKKADLSTLQKIFNKVIPNVVTSMSTEDMLALLPDIGKYQIVAEGGFPEESMRDTANLGGKGASCVIPVDLDQNVVWLHDFLFDEKDYTVSDTIKEYSEKIKADTTLFLDSKKER